MERELGKSGQAARLYDDDDDFDYSKMCIIKTKLRNGQKTAFFPKKGDLEIPQN